jgi:chromosome segregation protein
LRIKSLEIAGFKSFVDKVRFEFGTGTTGIVGPNGCGKSNVVDAIRWSMGEQSPRRLRGKGMEDVIFAGSEDRPPVGMAEVVLSFDASGGGAPPSFAAYSEIQVARRLYRSGESEYLINKVPVRLRDVQDFFRDTGIGTRGYTIVEQGRIAEIVSAKPEDRRSIIEEAAGISKYKARRQEAERKLEATDANLVRVNDVLSEIRRQIASIERQAKKAARYRRLRDLQRLLELSLAADERAELLSQVEDARRRALQARDAATAGEARLAECDAVCEAKRVAVAEGERAAVEKSEALFAVRSRIQELESRIAYERRERAALAEANVAREREREELLAQRAVAELEAERLAGELDGLEAALAAEALGVAAAEAEARAAAEALRERERERDAASAALVEVLTRVARTEDRRAVCEDRLAEIDQRLRTTEEQLEVQGTEADQAERQSEALEVGLRNLLAERDRLMGALRDAIDRHAHRADAARAAAASLREVGERRETKRARLASLREILERREDVGEGARHLLAQPDAAASHGIRGLVRDVLIVDRELEGAVEAALAERAQALVVTRPEGALAAIAALRGAQAGHGVFVLEPDEEPPAQGFVPLGRPLLDAVRVREGFEAVARRLLGGVHLVDDLAEAVRLYGRGRIPATFVTLGGDVLGRDGVMRGGAGIETGILGRAREVRELAEETERLDAERAAAEQRAIAADGALAAASDELENLRSRHHTAALAVANHEKDLDRSRERVKTIGEAREGRVEERAVLLAEAEALRAERERSDSLLASGREERSRRQRDLEALGLRIGSAGRDLARLEALAGERRAEHRARAESGERLRSSLAAARQRTAELGEWAARRERESAAASARRDELARSLGEAEQALAARLDDEEQARRTAEEARDAYERLAAEARELEEQTRALRAQLAEERERALQVELDLQERELRLTHLETQVRDRWSVELASWKAPVPAGPGELPEEPPAADAGEAADGAEAAAEGEESEAREAARAARLQAEALAEDGPARRTRLEETRRALEALGDVNLSAIDEHEELRERFRFLSEQKNDLESSIGQLREAIQRINRTSRKRFRETFDAIDEKFQVNFPRLFRGGKAKLSLTEHEDVLEAGIEIMAQPPGKRLQSVNLLSGGEKTMTALALLVSVFQVRPSPFFLLDEVDAALDDANIGRFNEVVLELARDSQFLLITHNKRTIEVADLLYGVTMEEKGVSKLVSVQLT